MGRIFLAVIVALSGAVALPSTAIAKPATASLYLVQVAGDPVASYDGGVRGLPATRPREGGKLDRQAWSYQAYRQHLRDQRTKVLHAAGVNAVVDYDTVFNGFAAKLTPTEKTTVEHTTGVVRVWKNEKRTLDTTSTPSFLGLGGDYGAWNQQFGDASHAGEGVIIGIIDTGFWPESPSLAALPEPRPDQAVIDKKWSADGIDKCDEGNGPVQTRITCNNKVIGARYYDQAGYGSWPDEFHSPRDYDGHGTHTATTAAGLHDIPAVVNKEAVGSVSGMAPAARLAIYKALWRQADGEGSGGTVDLMQAIDDAVTDGVDVINYSVSGSSSFVVDPIELAFFNAAAAGVFVATSAGNSGPAPATVAHNAPWTMTVAASSHDRGALKSVTLGDGKTLQGVGQGPAVPSAPLVDSVAAGLSGADATKVELCYPGMLNPAAVKGKIVLCKRGVNPRTDKSIAVRDAGGVGMILYNAEVNSLNADYHVIPTVHVGVAEGEQIKRYLKSTPTPTAALSATSVVVARAPDMAAFSSAGPAIAGGGDLLKPDITAPGVDVIAGVSPPGHHGNLYDSESGTSMSGPHIAGIAALIRAKHPTWSPAAVMSALMTTAGTIDNSGGPIQRIGKPATPLDYGAGHVRPARAFDPGLVYDSNPQDWIRYGCGIAQFQLVSDWCPTVGSIDPSDLNYPSIAVGDLPGDQTVTRTVTNVDSRASVYIASVQAPPGFTATVVPSAISVPAGQTATFTVKLDRTTAAYNAWSFGALTWTDLYNHVVRSPIALRPVALSGGGEITGTGATGHKGVDLRAGYDGIVTAKPYGLVTSTVSEQKLVGFNTGFVPTAPAASASVFKFPVTVPAGTKVARVATYDADSAPGTDLDLYAYQGGKLIDSSVGATADEQITLPTPGVFDVYVVQFGLPAQLTEQTVSVHTFLVGAASAGNLVVQPPTQQIIPKQLASFDVSWKDLDPKKRYLGVVEFTDGSAALAWTTVVIGP